MQYLRALLTKRGAITTAELARIEDGTRVWVGGAVTHRQRPATAGGITFLNLEDETGMANVLVSPGLWNRQRIVARTSAALLIRGQVQAGEGVVTLVADRLEHLNLAMATGPSRDFR
ncbi:OB-fold nucleic acid binding domain-containing protein [Amycolatopsis mediterranei]|uniref:OB-fold nucleic acid binding domain-containing protein n=1 Tax=Amycolatopsis mediterranei TaxID=33910 RepID=UPI0034283111